MFCTSLFTISYIVYLPCQDSWFSIVWGRLLLRTPSPVPYGICRCSFFRPLTLNHTYTSVWPLSRLEFLPALTLLLNIGFQRASATGVACWQGTLTPPDTWSRPFGTCICSTCWDQSFSELVVILPDYALRISLGTFSILLCAFIAMNLFIFSFVLLEWPWPRIWSYMWWKLNRHHGNKCHSLNYCKRRNFRVGVISPCCLPRENSPAR